MTTGGADQDGLSTKTGPATSRRCAVVALLALMLVPGLVLAISAAVSHAAAARWVFPYYDPDYQYLLNSVNLIEGAAPRHTDHPGTLVQEIGAAVLIARHVVSARDGSVREAVLRDPEGALTAISVCLRALHGAALLALGWFARRLTGSLACAMATQAASSLTAIGLFSLWRVDPEPLVMTVAVLIGGAVLLGVQSGNLTRFSAVSGVLAGLGLATKVTLLPLCAVPLWGVVRPRRLAVYIGCMLLTLLVVLAPILGQMPRVFGWLSRVAVNDGIQGVSRGHLILDPARYWFNLRRMATIEPAASVAAALSIGLLIHLWASGRWRRLDAPARRAAAALACVAAAQVMQYVMVAKHPGARYLLPALALAGVNVSLGYVLLKSAYSGVVLRIIAGAGLAILVAGAVRVGLRVDRDLGTWRRASAEVIERRAVVADEASHRSALPVSMYGTSSPVYALFYGDGWAGRRYESDLARLFPAEIIIDEFTRRYSLGGAPVSPEELRGWAADGRLLFQCAPAKLPLEFDYDEVRPVWGEGVFRAHPKADDATVHPDR